MRFLIKTMSLLPLVFSHARAWNLTFSNSESCARWDVTANSYLGDSGVSDPEPDDIVNISIEPVAFKTIAATEWDDDCKIEFWDGAVNLRVDPIFTLEKSDGKYVFEWEDDKVCIAGLPYTVAENEGSISWFRYVCP